MEEDVLIKAALAGLSPLSRKKYEGLFRSLLSFKPLDQLTPLDLRAWVALMQERVKPITLRTYLRRLVRLFEVAGRQDLLQEVRRLAKSMRAPPPKPRVSRELLESVQSLREAVKDLPLIRKAALLFLADTGVRVSELVSLTWDRIDLEARKALVRGKGEKDRVVYFTDYTASVLRELKAVSGGERVFPRSDRTIRRWVKQALNSSPHKVRHSFAILYLLRGGNIRALQAILGHSNLNTTQVYLDLVGGLVEGDYRRIMGS